MRHFSQCFLAFFMLAFLYSGIALEERLKSLFNHTSCHLLMHFPAHNNCNSTIKLMVWKRIKVIPLLLNGNKNHLFLKGVSVSAWIILTVVKLGKACGECKSLPVSFWERKTQNTEGQSTPKFLVKIFGL